MLRSTSLVLSAALLRRHSGVEAYFVYHYGDAQLSASLVDLLAEKFVEQLGQTLAGKRMSVREASIVGQRPDHKTKTSWTSRAFDHGLKAIATDSGAETALVAEPK